MKSKLQLGILIAGLILGVTYAFAGPPMEMSDRVRSLSLSDDGSSYDVVFAQHAAHYHVGSRSSAVKCLTDSARRKKTVTLTVDAQTLEIRSCALAK